MLLAGVIGVCERISLVLSQFATRLIDGCRLANAHLSARASSLCAHSKMLIMLMTSQARAPHHKGDLSSARTACSDARHIRVIIENNLSNHRRRRCNATQCIRFALAGANVVVVQSAPASAGAVCLCQMRGGHQGSSSSLTLPLFMSSGTFNKR